MHYKARQLRRGGHGAKTFGSSKWGNPQSVFRSGTHNKKTSQHLSTTHTKQTDESSNKQKPNKQTNKQAGEQAGGRAGRQARKQSTGQKAKDNRRDHGVDKPGSPWEPNAGPIQKSNIQVVALCVGSETFQCCQNCCS